MTIRFFDMFAGVGGFRSGLEAAGGFACAGHCEIDKYANQAYNAIYEPEGELYFEDARTINPNELCPTSTSSVRDFLVNLFRLLIWRDDCRTVRTACTDGRGNCRPIPAVGKENDYENRENVTNLSLLTNRYMTFSQVELGRGSLSEYRTPVFLFS